MTIKAVIFDLDGTLVEFKLDYKTVRSEVIRHLVNEGFPASVFSRNESIFEMLKKAEIYMKNSGKDKYDVTKMKGDVFRLAERFELQAAKDTAALPGVSETLKALKKMHLKLGLLTVNSDLATDYLLQHLRLKRFFDTVVTRDSVDMVKPSPKHLAAVLQKLSVEPEEALLVGDSVIDMRSAAELKSIGVGIPTGISTPQALIHAGATCIITSLTDLPTLVHQFSEQVKLHA